MRFDRPIRKRVQFVDKQPHIHQVGERRAVGFEVMPVAGSIDGHKLNFCVFRVKHL